VAFKLGVVFISGAASQKEAGPEYQECVKGPERDNPKRGEEFLARLYIAAPPQKYQPERRQHYCRDYQQSYRPGLVASR
jgi:hypothetical protein